MLKTGTNTKYQDSSIKSESTADIIKKANIGQNNCKGEGTTSDIVHTSGSGNVTGLGTKQLLTATTDSHGGFAYSDPVVTVLKNPRGRPRKYPATATKDITIVPAVLSETDKYFATPVPNPDIAKQLRDLQRGS